MRKWMTALPVAGTFAFSAAVYSRLPEWGTPNLSALLPVAIPAGEPIPRLAAALLIPTVALGVWALLTALSKVQGPRKPLPEWWLNENTGSASVKRFEPTFDTIIFAVTALIALMHVALIGGLLGWPSWSYRILTAILGAGVIAAGNVMPRTRPNWIVGLRTKRNLADPAIWSRSHRRLGAFMIVAGCLILLASAAFPEYALVTGVVSLLVAFAAAGLGSPSGRPLPSTPPASSSRQ